MYMLKVGANPVLLLFIAVITGLLSLTLDYIVGYFFYKKIIKKLIGNKKFEKSKDEIYKYGWIAILLFTLLPISSPILMLVAGMIRYNYRDVLTYSFVGLSLKYGFLLLIVIL